MITKVRLSKGTGGEVQIEGFMSIVTSVQYARLCLLERTVNKFAASAITMQRNTGFPGLKDG